MRVESAANAACVREEIVCISTYFSHHSLSGSFKLSLRAQAAIAAGAPKGQFVGSAGLGRLGRLYRRIPQQRVTGVRL